MAKNQLPISISTGNSKMGAIPSWSLTPGITCSKEACATCYRQGCYAKKLYNLRPNVRTAYDRNTNFVKENLPEFIRIMDLWLQLNEPRKFRVHVSGDFFSREYALAWAEIANRNPQTVFLAFTKQFANVDGVDFPENFKLYLSGWPGMEIPEHLREQYHTAWMQDGTETRIPEGCHECPETAPSAASSAGPATAIHISTNTERGIQNGSSEKGKRERRIRTGQIVAAWLLQYRSSSR